jgi:hypothetical protein
MNPRHLSRPEVVDFARNAAAAVAAGKIAGITPAEAADLVAALNAATDKLAESDQKVVAARAAYHEATQNASVDEADVIKILTTLKFKMRGLHSSASEYKAAGFDPPADPTNRIEPVAPTNLSAAGFFNGLNRLKYRGNNPPGTVIYTIEGRTSLTAEYSIVGSTHKQSFKHAPVTPGQFYQYRVRAEATSGLVSEWSNEAVVYPPETHSRDGLQ